MQRLSPPSLRPIRSFMSRQGRMTQARATAWEKLWQIYGLSIDSRDLLDLDRLFGRTSEKVLEIGFGNGKSLLEMAKNSPEKDFIGVEVYRNGVANLLVEMEKQQLSNVRIFCADVIEVLKYKIPENSLMAVQIFFPDPWPKVRHHKRRLVQPAFVEEIATKLKKEGSLHLSTDWMDYAYYMLAVISASDRFLNLAGAGQFMPRPAFRPVTKYEQRGLKSGHQTWDLIFKRVAL